MGIEMYPYLSPTGAGMTSNKGLAERMEQLRLEYIEACEKSNYAHKGRIQSEENSLAILIHNEKMIEEREIERLKTASAGRFIRVVEYYSVPIDTGRGFSKSDVRDHLVYLDTYEIEMIITPRANGFGDHVIKMKSGREISVSEEDLTRVEAAMRERK